MLESLPGIFVEHDDDHVGPCLSDPTPFNPNAGPLDEAAALEKVKKILDGKEHSEEKSSSDKENDREEGRVGDVSKTYSKKNSSALKQKVLAAKNGSVTIKTEPSDVVENGETSTSVAAGDIAEVMASEPRFYQKNNFLSLSDVDGSYVITALVEDLGGNRANEEDASAVKVQNKYRKFFSKNNFKITALAKTSDSL